MRNSLLISFVLLVGCQVCLQSKLQNNLNHVEFLYTRIQKHARNPRDLSYIWNKIKSKIAKAWEAFKKITDKTKQRLQDYLRKINEKTEIVCANFKNKINRLNKDFSKVIENVILTGKNVKVCVENDKEVIENLLNKILVNVTICISNNIKSMVKIKLSHDPLHFDDSLFLRSIEDKMTHGLKTCENNNSQCFDSFQDEILNDLDVATWTVSQKALTVRNTADDGLENIMNCVTEALSKAIISLVGKSLQIIICVKSKQ